MAQTFEASFLGVNFAANKPMATVLNNSAGQIIKIRKVILNNFQTAAVTGVACTMELRYYSVNPTVNTPANVTPTSRDSANTAPVSLTTASGASLTGGTIGGTLRRIFWSSDEPAISVASNDELQCLLPLNEIYAWIPSSDIQPITLNNGQGLVLFNTAGATGLVDCYIEFTKE